MTRIITVELTKILDEPATADNVDKHTFYHKVLSTLLPDMDHVNVVCVQDFDTNDFAEVTP